MALVSPELASRRSPLLRLPVEIRSNIYDQYFKSLDFQLLSVRNTSTSANPMQCRSTSPKHEALLSILRVSQQVRHEALPHLSRSWFTITALFPGWHQASRDFLDIPSIHRELVKTLELRFLDSNFSVLPSLPNLERVYIVPPGNHRCRGWSDDPASKSGCYTREEVDGKRGRREMTRELVDSLELMHELIQRSEIDMKFEVHFSVHFKFLIKPLHWSHSGRLLSMKGNFRSVVRIYVP
jgi:hypothetical protein